MARITYFVALPFDVADGRVFVGEPIECPSPVATIERAKGLWKVLGHAGVVAFGRTGNPATGDFSDATVLRKFGDLPERLLMIDSDSKRRIGIIVNSCSISCRSSRNCFAYRDHW